MPATLDDAARKLLEAPNFAHVVTMGKDGRPHAVLVWVHTDGERVTLNSAEGRTWPTNARRDPRVTLTVPNQDNPYEYVTLQGRVVEDTHEGADEDIDFLAKKYMDADTYPFRKEGEQRIIFRIEPEKVRVYGGS